MLYDCDSNAIIVRPLCNRSAQEIQRVFTSVHAYLVARGLRPCLHTLDNEASTNLKDFLTAEKVEYQLVPPHIHRRNSAERAIQTFKNQFIAGLASTDPNFPLSNWCRLLPQTELTLNLLRPSRLNPKLSPYAQLEGAFDFTCTPLAPPGTHVIVHEKPTQRRTWALHSINGWYIGPAMDHYQCYRVWISSTHAKRIADTIQFFPTILCTPNLSHHDATLQAARKLTHALQNLNNANPLLQLSDDQLRALDQISTLFPPGAPGVEHNSSPEPTPSPSPPIQPSYNLRPRPHIHRRHHPQVLVLPLNHATTCILDLTTPPPSPMLTPTDLWNTATSLRIPPLAMSGSAPPPTNLDDLPKASPTIASTPPTPSYSSPSPKSHATNARPMHDSSAVFAHKNLNHIAPASQSVVI